MNLRLCVGVPLSTECGSYIPEHQGLTCFLFFLFFCFYFFRVVMWNLLVGCSDCGRVLSMLDAEGHSPLDLAQQGKGKK